MAKIEPDRHKTDAYYALWLSILEAGDRVKVQYDCYDDGHCVHRKIVARTTEYILCTGNESGSVHYKFNPETGICKLATGTVGQIFPFIDKPAEFDKVCLEIFEATGHWGKCDPQR